MNVYKLFTVTAVRFSHHIWTVINLLFELSILNFDMARSGYKFYVTGAIHGRSQSHLTYIAYPAPGGC